MAGHRPHYLVPARCRGTSVGRDSGERSRRSPVLEIVHELGGNLQSHTGLPGTSGTYEGQELVRGCATARTQLPLPLAPDERLWPAREGCWSRLKGP